MDSRPHASTRKPRRRQPQWLLLKSGSGVAPISQRAEDRSIPTGHSLDQIASANDREWQSNRNASRPGSQRAENLTRVRSFRRHSSSQATASNRNASHSDPNGETTAFPSAEINLRRLRKAKPAFVEPMKALLVDTLSKDAEWIYELKFDGVRALAIKRNREVELISRSEKDLGSKYSELLAPLRKLAAKEFVLDGDQRKAMAETLLANASPAIRFSPGIKADSAQLVREMQARGLEGLIAKRRDCKYEPGRRSGVWVKFKWTNEQEFIIGGYTQPKGTRTHFGALLVGYYEKGKLLFAAKVGTGFDQKLFASLYEKFNKLIRSDCPFANLPEKISGRWGQGLSLAEMHRCTWLEPRLVCQIRFAEWTRDNHLRQPAFLGLREDKEPKEVVREKPQ